MVDVLTAEQRRRNMANIRATNTKPEMLIRRMLHSRGYRYRLHRADLPGKPDLVFPRRMKIVFVNGCFWHSHSCRYGRVTPATNVEFWAKKRAATVLRDASNTTALEELGWGVLTVWECETREMDELSGKLIDFLE